MAVVEGVYRVLGAIAPINERLWRHRINLIPANILLMVGLGALAAVGWNSFARVLASREPPQVQTVDALLSTTRFAQGYVAVQGKLMATSRLSFDESNSAGNLALADYTWAPLVDAQTGRAFLVQYAAGHTFPEDGADVNVEGILRPVNSAVERRLKEAKYVHAGIPIHRSFMLIAGRRPGSLQGPLVTGTVFGALALLLAWSTFRRNVVFMPTEQTLSGRSGALFDTPSAEPLLVSATLSLDAKTRQFFNNMPAIVHRMESGDVALLSHITTSSTVFHVKTNERSGVWMLPMRAGSITEAQSGYVFWGLKKMRATRFQYVNAMSGASERAVVAYPAHAGAPVPQPA